MLLMLRVGKALVDDEDEVDVLETLLERLENGDEVLERPVEVADDVLETLLGRLEDDDEVLENPVEVADDVLERLLLVDDVTVLDPRLPEEVVEMLLVVDITVELLLEGDDDELEAALYSSRRLPDPQYSRLFPGQRNLQSAGLVD